MSPYISDYALDPACWSWPVTVAADERSLIAWQAGRCAVCGRPAFNRDHDHATGLLRGYLCRSCNASEGTAHTGQAPIFAKYRRLPPAVLLGLGVPARSVVRYRPGTRSGTRHATTPAL